MADSGQAPRGPALGLSATDNQGSHDRLSRASCPFGVRKGGSLTGKRWAVDGREKRTSEAAGGDCRKLTPNESSDTFHTMLRPSR
eukprot:1015664-Rhodomonas_salina.2